MAMYDFGSGFLTGLANQVNRGIDRKDDQRRLKEQQDFNLMLSNLQRDRMLDDRAALWGRQDELREEDLKLNAVEGVRMRQQAKDAKIEERAWQVGQDQLNHQRGLEKIEAEKSGRGGRSESNPFFKIMSEMLDIEKQHGSDSTLYPPTVAARYNALAGMLDIGNGTVDGQPTVKSLSDEELFQKLKAINENMFEYYAKYSFDNLKDDDKARALGAAEAVNNDLYKYLVNRNKNYAPLPTPYLGSSNYMSEENVKSLIDYIPERSSVKK